MPKYEIWGDEAGKFALLGYMTGELPAAADTMLVRGHVREVEKVWRHHAGTQILQRVKVGPPVAVADALETEPDLSRV